MDPSIYEQAKILQLTGNCKLESLLEFINAKTAINPLHKPGTTSNFALLAYKGVSKD